MITSVQRFVILGGLLLGLCPGPSQGQGSQPPSALPGESLYLGRGQALEAQAPRQLTLNAHVQQAAFQPGGLAVAYAGGRLDGDALTLTVQMIGLHGDTPRPLWSRRVALGALADSLGLDGDGASALRERIDDALPMFRRGQFLNLISLQGWSSDGRYLLIKLQDVVPEGAGAGYRFEDFYTSIDVAADPPRLRPVPLAALLPPDDILADSRVSWSPQHTRLLLTAIGQKGRVPGWYDFAENRVRALPDGAGVFQGWADDSHWLFAAPKAGGPGETQFVQDIATGRRTEAQRPLSAVGDGGGWVSPVSPKNPELALDVEVKRIEDEGKQSAFYIHPIWLRRANAPKAFSTLSVGLISGVAAGPPQWSPTGGQIAFVSHGDLFMTDLTPRDASARQKLLGGETLTCAEENEIARANMKQIGLALFQYALDRDETFPPPGGLEARLAAYVKDPSVYSVGAARFAYQPPAARKIGQIENPAQTPLATMDLPCARDVLYADGHVGTFPK